LLDTKIKGLNYLTAIYITVYSISNRKLFIQIENLQENSAYQPEVKHDHEGNECNCEHWLRSD